MYHGRYYTGGKCIDGLDGQTSLCHTKKERYPFLVVEYDNPVKVSEVRIYNRDDCCGDRLKNLHVIVTDQYPEVGKMAEGMNVSIGFGGSTLIGETTFVVLEKASIL